MSPCLDTHSKIIIVWFSWYMGQHIDCRQTTWCSGCYVTHPDRSCFHLRRIRSSLDQEDNSAGSEASSPLIKVFTLALPVRFCPLYLLYKWLQRSSFRAGYMVVTPTPISLTKSRILLLWFFHHIGCRIHRLHLFRELRPHPTPKRVAWRWH